MSSPMNKVSPMVSSQISNYLTNVQTWGGVIYNVKSNGAKGDGVSDDTAAINKTIEEAGTSGIVCFPPATYVISGKVTFNGLVQGDGATLLVTTNLPIAVEVREGTGTTLYRGKRSTLPNVIKQTKTWDGTDIGIQLTNVLESTINFGKIRNFSVGLNVVGDGAGNAWNSLFLSYMDNNKINLRFQPLNGGYTNQNNVYGGRFGQDSSNGTNVSGTRHIVLSNAASSPNNNSFYGCSVEGNVVEYQIECSGSQNYFYNLRYEATTPKVWWKDSATSNVIFYGYAADGITFTEDAGARWNTIHKPIGGIRMQGSGARGIFIGSNTNGSEVFVALDSTAALGANPSTAYAMAVGATFYRGKRSTDNFDRIQIDNTTGRIAMGNGSAAPTVQLGPMATAVSSTPAFVGQIAVVGGVGYMATGTSSSADWKQITN